MENKTNWSKEIRFYVLTILAAFLLITGLFAEPPGEIHSTVITASGLLLVVASAVVGVDVKGIIREWRLTKQTLIEETDEKA